MSSEEPKPKKDKEGFWQKHRYSIFMPPILLALLVAISLSETYLFVEYLSINVRYRARVDSDPEAHKDLVVVGINDASIESLGRYPWPRNIYGDFMQLLTLVEPKVISYDIFFPETSSALRENLIAKMQEVQPQMYEGDPEQGKSELQRMLDVFNTVYPDHDTYMADAMMMHYNVLTGALSQMPKVVGGEVEIPEDENHPDTVEGSSMVPFTNIQGDVEQIYGYGTALYPIDVFQQSAYVGFVDTEASSIDGIRRRYPLILRTGAQVYASLALKSAMLYYDVFESDVEIVLGKHVALNLLDGTVKKIPINEKGEFIINYRREEALKAIGFAHAMNTLLKMYKNGTPWPEDFPKLEGSILVIGQTAAGLTDLGPTPLKGRSPLVRVQANVVDNILKDDYLTIPPLWPFILGSLFLMWVTLVALKDRPLYLSVGIPALIVAVYVAITFWVFARFSIQFPLVWPVIGFIGVHMGAYYLHWRKEADQKKRITGMFGTYLSPELVSQMVDSGDEPKLGGEDVNITAFFSDVQSFSSFSEKLTPQQLVDLMNEYLTAMTKILMENKCYVDKYIGDAIVGIFNAPVEVQGHALKGCISCMLQHKKLEELRQKWRSEGDKWPPIVHNMQARIGMNTGQATVGNMGSENRFNYTMMGDTVNLAARCESGAKAYGVYTMITGETKEAAEAEGDDCVFRYLDKIIVKGRSVPAEMYEVVCLREDLNDETERCLKRYDEAMKLYLSQQWDAAYEAFCESAKLEPNRKELNPSSPTTPSDVMSKRALDMKANPPVAPGETWDGVYVMTTK